MFCWTWKKRNKSNLDIDEHCGLTCHINVVWPFETSFLFYLILVLCFLWPLLNTTAAWDTWTGAIVKQPNGKQINNNNLPRWCFHSSLEENNNNNKNTFPSDMGARSVHFQRVEIVMCGFFVCLFFSSTSSYQQAILHLPTLELFIETGTNQDIKINSKLWNRCPFSFQQWQAITLVVVFVSTLWNTPISPPLLFKDTYLCVCVTVQKANSICLFLCIYIHIQIA